ncbi:hypothetical protein HY411_00965, partial [Candidatus Gottesmanbacteria bacterium]|nr:hypothetical protein [Candidatus Gottesmanbacteria bacterium]
EKNGKPETPVMAPYEISTMIPAFTGRRVMAGHAMFTKDVAAKKALISSFFATRDPAYAQRILSSYTIGWVLADVVWTPPQDSRLVRRFGNGSYTLYSRQ